VIVIDASIAAKWYLQEAGTEAATALLDDVELLAAPDLIGIEVASAISRRARLGQISTDDAMRLMLMWQADLSDALLRLEAWRLDFAEACRLACTIAHPIADCLYLATAIRLDATLVTADLAFARRASAAWPRIRAP
jgi:predicted nucleic acid-binding protein